MWGPSLCRAATAELRGGNCGENTSAQRNIIQRALTSNLAPAMSTWSTTWSCGRAPRSSQPLKSSAATDASADGCRVGTNMLPELCPGSPCRRRRKASAARFSSPGCLLRPRWSLATPASDVLIGTCSTAPALALLTHQT